MIFYSRGSMTATFCQTLLFLLRSAKKLDVHLRLFLKIEVSSFFRSPPLSSKDWKKRGDRPVRKRENVQRSEEKFVFKTCLIFHNIFAVFEEEGNPIFRSAFISKSSDFALTKQKKISVDKKSSKRNFLLILTGRIFVY